jgi:hypothetical protein
MLRVKASDKQILRRPNLRSNVAGLTQKTTSPGENLVQLVKVLETVEVTPERLEINSKYIQAADGSKIEY